MKHRYLIALGSNRRHHRFGRPEGVLRAAITALTETVGIVEAASPISASPALGPSRRRFANGAVVLRTPLGPATLLVRLKAIERAFGRRRGRRWGERVLDLDIVLWSGGRWRARTLTIPHLAFRERLFVLAPASHIAPVWRDPITGMSLRQLCARLTRPIALPIGHSRKGP